eukprot:2918997-Pyramimonas_sp.AAC.1
MQDLFNTQIDVASTKLQAVCNETLKKAQDDFQSSMRMCFKQILATNAKGRPAQPHHRRHPTSAK